MVVIARRTLTTWQTQYPDAAENLAIWYGLVDKADWNSFNALKEQFGKASHIGNDRYIFNINNNTYRLCALISFQTRTVYLKGFFTHREYDRLTDAGTLNQL